MTDSKPKHRQHQLILVLLLFLISQLTLALHSHDLSLHSVDTEECVVCLVTASDDPALVFEAAERFCPIENSQVLPAFSLLTPQPQLTPSQPRAPPLS
jgi:hypothetical protein